MQAIVLFNLQNIHSACHHYAGKIITCNNTVSKLFRSLLRNIKLRFFHAIIYNSRLSIKKCNQIRILKI